MFLSVDRDRSGDTLQHDPHEAIIALEHPVGVHQRRGHAGLAASVSLMAGGTGEGVQLFALRELRLLRIRQRAQRREWLDARLAVPKEQIVDGVGELGLLLVFGFLEHGEHLRFFVEVNRLALGFVSRDTPQDGQSLPALNAPAVGGVDQLADPRRAAFAEDTVRKCLDDVGTMLGGAPSSFGEQQLKEFEFLAGQAGECGVHDVWFVGVIVECAANAHVGEDVSVGPEGEHHLAKLGDVVRAGIEHELINDGVAAGQLEPRLGEAGGRHADTAIAVAQCIEHDCGADGRTALERPECVHPPKRVVAVGGELGQVRVYVFRALDEQPLGGVAGPAIFTAQRDNELFAAGLGQVLKRLAGAHVNHAINSAFVYVLLQSATLGLSS